MCFFLSPMASGQDTVFKVVLETTFWDVQFALCV